MMNLYFFAATLLLVYMTSIFLVALFLKDNSIVDIAYGAGFVLVGWCVYLVYGDIHPRVYLVLLLITLWGVRLATHIYLRKKGEQGEDFRYRQWRESWGKTFVPRSYLQIFMLQGAVIYVISLPMLFILHRPGPDLGFLDLLGCLVWLFGFAFEAVGDWQLLLFKNNEANRGRVMQSGLWRYTRHPNYFGEATLWWGVYLIALGSPLGLWAMASPLLINFLLFKVSGVPMLEAKYEGNPEFEAYKRRTNAVIPWIPRGK